MQTRKNFIFINDSFTCQHCSHANPPRLTGCRNHCRKCLYSLHVDLEVPGDRESDCHGLMKPIGLDYSGKKGQMIIHECQKCKHQMRNMVAADDSVQAIITIQHAD